MAGITMRSSIVSAGVGNLSSLREDRFACASPTSQFGAIRQLSSSSSSGALRFLGRSNVTNFGAGDQVHGCRRSGSSTSIVCLAKPDGTRGTEHPDGSPFQLSAVAVPILAAVMVGAVQPNVLALEGDNFALESDRFAIPDKGDNFSAPSGGGLQPKIEKPKGDQYSDASKGKEPTVDGLKNSQSSRPTFYGLVPERAGEELGKGENSNPSTPVFRSVVNDESSITNSSPFLRTGSTYTLPAKPAPPVRDI